MHGTKQTNKYDANLLSKRDKLKSCVSQLYQTKHGNITLSKVIRTIKRNNYNLIKYMKQETGYNEEEIMEELLRLQYIEDRDQPKLRYPYGHFSPPVTSRLNFNCRFNISLCQHTQRIQQEIKKGINEIQLDKQLVDGFTNKLLSSDLIQMIMMYYCIKLVLLPEDKANYLGCHYRQCLNWIKHANKSISYAKFYEIELMPALINVTQERTNGFVKRTNTYIAPPKLLTVADFVPKRTTTKLPATTKLPNRYKYFVKTKRNNKSKYINRLL